MDLKVTIIEWHNRFPSTIAGGKRSNSLILQENGIEFELQYQLPQVF